MENQKYMPESLGSGHTVTNGRKKAKTRIDNEVYLVAIYFEESIILFGRRHHKNTDDLLRGYDISPERIERLVHLLRSTHLRYRFRYIFRILSNRRGFEFELPLNDD